jgi:hypothetical protein
MKRQQARVAAWEQLRQRIRQRSAAPSVHAYNTTVRVQQERVQRERFAQERRARLRS